MVRVRSKSQSSTNGTILSYNTMIICVIIVIVTVITIMTLNTAPFQQQKSILSSSSNPQIRGYGITKSLNINSSNKYDYINNRDGPSIYYDSTNDDQCRFYLAESAIPYSGLGIFTSISIPKGGMTQSMEDICIYVADTPKGDSTHFETHSWSRDTWLGTFEGKNPRAACEGVATLFNSMPPGIQTSKLHMSHEPHNVNLYRNKDVNAGAITQYDGISSIATRDVPAGAEITIDYQDFHYDDDKKYEAPYRTVSWLQKHGMCIDNIRIATATDPKMGRGAYANRSMKQGTRIAPAPIQVFPDRSIFTKVQTMKGQPEPQFINYCFTMDDPNNKNGMLLFPYGPGVNLINHSSESPNVIVQWSYHPMHHHTWLDLPYDQYEIMDYPGGLILDVIALRDIEEGEELFMDYGTEWEKAWEQHIKSWKPHKSSKTYVYPQDIDRTKPFRTLQEQKKEPYAPNLATICWTSNWPDNAKTNKLKWAKPKRYDWPEGVTFCHILSRTKLPNGEYEYEVSLHYEMDSPGNVNDQSYIDTNVPQSAISFVDLPYHSDLHLNNAFRHPIMLPKQLIPSKWVSSSKKQ